MAYTMSYYLKLTIMCKNDDNPFELVVINAIFLVRKPAMNTDKD